MGLLRWIKNRRKKRLVEIDASKIELRDGVAYAKGIINPAFEEADRLARRKKFAYTADPGPPPGFIEAELEWQERSRPRPKPKSKLNKRRECPGCGAPLEYGGEGCRYCGIGMRKCKQQQLPSEHRLYVDGGHGHDLTGNSSLERPFGTVGMAQLRVGREGKLAYSSDADDRIVVMRKGMFIALPRVNLSCVKTFPA